MLYRRLISASPQARKKDQAAEDEYDHRTEPASLAYDAGKATSHTGRGRNKDMKRKPPLTYSVSLRRKKPHRREDPPNHIFWQENCSIRALLRE
jgi:hypothetical protein